MMSVKQIKPTEKTAGPLVSPMGSQEAPKTKHPEKKKTAKKGAANRPSKAPKNRRRKVGLPEGSLPARNDAQGPTEPSATPIWLMLIVFFIQVVFNACATFLFEEGQIDARILLTVNCVFGCVIPTWTARNRRGGPRIRAAAKLIALLALAVALTASLILGDQRLPYWASTLVQLAATAYSVFDRARRFLFDQVGGSINIYSWAAVQLVPILQGSEIATCALSVAGLLTAYGLIDWAVRTAIVGSVKEFGRLIVGVGRRLWRLFF